jgi:hypothetical protein
MTEAECRLAGRLAREAMVYELGHPGRRSYAQMAERVEQTVIDKLLEEMQKGLPVYASQGPPVRKEN